MALKPALGELYKSTQLAPISDANSKIFLEKGTALSPYHSGSGERQLFPTLHPVGAFGASILADLAPTAIELGAYNGASSPCNPEASTVRFHTSFSRKRSLTRVTIFTHKRLLQTSQLIASSACSA